MQQHVGNRQIVVEDGLPLASTHRLAGAVIHLRRESGPLPASASLHRDAALRARTQVARWAGSAIAIKPGRMTRNGKNIFGTAAISGVRRAAVMESAAMARCTTRKSVHQ